MQQMQAQQFLGGADMNGLLQGDLMAFQAAAAAGMGAGYPATAGRSHAITDLGLAAGLPTGNGAAAGAAAGLRPNPRGFIVTDAGLLPHGSGHSSENPLLPCLEATAQLPAR